MNNQEKTNKFIQKANAIHNFNYNYDKVDYIGGHKKVIITCKEHGDFEQEPSAHLARQGCPTCGKNRAHNSQKYTLEEFIEKAKNIHKDTYCYDKVNYIDNKTKVIITCKEHGDFEQLPHNHLFGKGCYDCKNEKISETKTLTTQEFIEKAIKVHGYIYNYDKVNYVETHDKVIIVCSIHGKFKQHPSNHLRGSCCPKCTCNVSRIGSRWLDSLGIPNDDEHREVGKLIPGRNFKVDGFDPETNTVYEFYGDRPHGNLNLYDPDDKGPYGTTYGELYSKTMDREKIFKDAGFNLVTIWESDFRKQLVREFVERSINKVVQKDVA